MIKPIRRSTGRAGSLKILKRRITYLEDKTHEDHKKLTIYNSVNYNCSGPKGQDFEAQCVKAHKEYLASPERSKGGKPNKRLFEEFIYSSPEGAHLNELERKIIEMTIVNNFARHSAVRCGWHVNEKSGRCDLHVLIAAKNSDWPARLTIASQFGDGKPNIIGVINKVSDGIIQDLNKSRETKLKSAMSVFRERKAEMFGKRPSLAGELASLDIAPKDLRRGIEGLGYEVTRENDKTISVKFPGAKRASKYNRADLIREMATFEVIGKDIAPVTLPVTPPKPTTPKPPSQPTKPKPEPIPEPIPEPKKETKPWKPRIDWASEAKKDKDKPS